MTQSSYDDVNRQVRDKEALTGAVYFEYDSVGNRTKVGLDGADDVYWFDEVNRLSCVVSPDSKATYYAYDDNGLASRVLPPTGPSTYFHYDARMQRRAVDFAGTLTYFLWDGMNQLADSACGNAADWLALSTIRSGVGMDVCTKGTGTSARCRLSGWTLQAWTCKPASIARQASWRGLSP